MRLTVASHIFMSSAHSIGVYQFVTFLGSGSFGGVWECRNMTNKKPCACKIIDLEMCLSDDFYTHFKNELYIHSRIRHPGIAQLIDVLRDKENVYIIIELCDGGDLNEIVQDEGGLSEPEAKHYFYQLMSALSYIHRLGVAHRDIKLENILITSDDHAKLTDFGLCKQTQGNSPMLTTCGTLVYAAPEIIQEKPYNGIKADVWSAGVVLYAMIACHFPWATEDNLPPERLMHETANQILDGEIQMPEGISMELQNLLACMLNADPDERPTSEEVLQHPWLADEEDDNYGQNTDPDPQLIQLVESLVSDLDARKEEARARLKGTK